jgi:GTPase SAR1 family protein
MIREADAWIRDKHYTTEHLEITRLSGSPLPMVRCYINLTLTDQHRKHLNVSSNGEGEGPPSSPSPFSLEDRLNIETPRKEDLIKLTTLFDEREQPDGIRLRPRRILIRGCAGVGKTTLCKKIVHDFITEGMWQNLFQRVIWVQLRDLKTMPKPYTLDGMLREIFFWEGPSRDSLSGALARCMDEDQSRETLFLLDGLDEVAEMVMERRNGPSHDARRFLQGLLNRPNVLITARPQAGILHGCQRPDMDLDTIGFGETEVEEYIDTVVVDHEDAMAIKTYLRKNQLMQSLVRIPIQLDALCFTLKDDIHDQDSTMEEIPRMMTSIYTAITQKL